MKILDNGIAVLENDTHISKWVEHHGTLLHNPSLYNELKKYVPENSIILEGGGCIGDNTSFLSKIGTVISFEPNKDAFECLKHNFGSVENVVIHNKGLSDKKGKAEIVKDVNAGASYLKEGKGVDVITVDSLNLEKLDFIILDCEGFEHKILKGAEKTIERFKPVMLIEINNHALLRNGTSNNDIYIYLTELGYNYKNIYPNQSLYEDQLDLICLPK